VRDGGAEIVLLAAALVERARRGADAPEVEAEGREPCFVTDLRGPDDDGVLHVAAVERMGMTQCDATRDPLRDRQTSVEREASCDGKCHPALGYHDRMRIPTGWWTVQPAC
jgi:hypothetical protein